MQHERESNLAVELRISGSSDVNEHIGIDALLAAGRIRTERLPGVVTGTLRDWDDQGLPLVDYAGCPGGIPVAARSTVPLNQTPLGQEVALAFVDGDGYQP